MKILFFTHYKSNPASMFHSQAFSKNKNFYFDQNDNFENYDCIVFMSYKKDLETLKKIKKKYPNIKIGVCDGKGSIVFKYIEFIDFLVVNSIEMKLFFSKYCANIFIFNEFPDLNFKIDNLDKKKDKVIIGYHGNKMHLNSMYPDVTSAIEKLSKKYPIELHLIYNINELGIWKAGRPKNVLIKDIQWSMNAMVENLSNWDLGIYFGGTPIQNLLVTKRLSSNYFLGNNDDYFLRFKMKNNPGKIITFFQAGVPVIADLNPSALQLIDDGYNGEIAHGISSWYYKLEKLISSPELRSIYRTRSLKKIDNKYSLQYQSDELVKYIINLKENKIFPQIKTALKDRIKYKLNSYIDDLKYNFSKLIKKIFKFINYRKNK